MIEAKPGDALSRVRHLRGQALVEFAVVLPVMLLLALTALDFGRVYLGWINLQNMTRAASNFAANHPDAAWANPLDPVVIEYQNQVRNDGTRTNCVVANPGPPTFADGNGDGTTNAIGDSVTVSFTCPFRLITPFLSAFFGNTINVSSTSVFPVKSGQFATVVPTGPVAAFSASPTTTTIGTNIAFTDSSAGSPTTWAWAFGDGVTASTKNATHAYGAAGVYSVTLTVTNTAGSSTLTKTSYITINAPAPVANFTGTPTSIPVGGVVSFTDTSTGSPTAWAWTFGDGATSNVGPSVSHGYNTAGTFTVSLTVTSASGSNSITKMNYIVVSAPPCNVPNFINTSSSNAQATWNAAGFTTTVQFQQGGLPWTIKSQSQVASSSLPCTSSVTVSKN